MANRSDDFERNNGQDLDSFPTPSDAGSDWIRLTSTGMYFDNGKLGPYSNKMNMAVLESSEADGEAAATYLNHVSNILIVFRCVDVNNLLYVIFEQGASRAQLHKIESGSDTQVGSDFSITTVSGDIASVTFSGSTIDIEKNGTPQSTGWSSSFNSSATKHGVGFAGNGADEIGLFAFAGSGAAGTTVTPTTASLTITAFAPTVSTPRLVTPGTATISLTTFAPTVSTPRLVTPTTPTLTIAGLAPTVSTPRLVTPTTRALTLTTFAPTVSVPGLITPVTATLTITTFAPTVSTTVSGDVLCTPITLSLVLTTFAPTVTAGGQSVDPRAFMSAMARRNRRRAFDIWRWRW